MARRRGPLKRVGNAADNVAVAAWRIAEIADDVDDEIDAAQTVGFIEHEIDLSQTALAPLRTIAVHLMRQFFPHVKFDEPAGIIKIRSKMPSALLRVNKTED